MLLRKGINKRETNSEELDQVAGNAKDAIRDWIVGVKLLVFFRTIRQLIN